MMIEKLIINALSNCNPPSELTMVLSDRNGVVPKTPYLTIDILDVVGIGSSVKTVNELYQITRQVKEYEVTLTFQLEATSPIQDWVHWFYNGLETDFITYQFEKEGIGVVYYDDIKYQPNPVNGLNFKRVILEMTIRTEEEYRYEVNQINKIDFEGKLDDVDFYQSIDLVEGKNDN